MRGDSRALFAALRRAQPNAYAAWLDFAADVQGGADDTIVSVSPELFFDWRAGRLLARPMKGTAPRGADAAADAAQAERLRNSDKERAENLMIVDLLRNDLSRVAEPFSVQVNNLFRTEAWPTVWQMSSDVVARTRPGTTLAEVFGALFPCGLDHGRAEGAGDAPDQVDRAQAARRLHWQARSAPVRPGGAATFNVPIRTLELRGNGAQRAVRCGIGSGITSDATAAGEWDEWRHKRAFVDRASRAFELLETLRLEDGVPRQADAHVARMTQAAAHFGFDSPERAAHDALAAAATTHPGGRWRVRLLADRTGAACAQVFPLEATAQPVLVRLADAPLAGADGEFVRFKTTRRAHYDALAPRARTAFDTLLWNERGELTEFTRGNVAVRLDGRWLTPALRCGLLPGIERARLLRDGVLDEATLTRDDLARATGDAFFNSLRGWLEAEWVPGSR